MSQHDFSDFKIGIVGAGLMGRWHAHAASRLGAQVAAIVDSSAPAAEALSTRYRGASTYSDIGYLLKNEDVAALHICTQLASHYELVSQALCRGVHVLIEKPVTATAGETGTLLQLANEHGVILCPVHQFAFQKSVIRAPSVIDTLGEVLRVNFRTHSAGAEGLGPGFANGVIADILPHPLSVLQKLFPGSLLHTSGWQSLQTRPGELQLSGSVGGVGVNIDISMNARPTRCEMDVCCTRGRVYFNFFHGYSLVERGRTNRLQKMLQPIKYATKELTVSIANLAMRTISGERAYPGLRALVGAFYQAIQDKTAGPISPADVLALAEMRDQLIINGLPGLKHERPDA